ncbi:Demethylmenaquinone methyltransferase [Fusarium austroafricanum]|uniref:Demethylmenaquinone methyltransferase n=1 Tax=Fusarium austroafricanum TaxID=2364996 RepID=A0A8H4P4S6_9HYPO|nr:Demethylmenaquinone methyltransferase [Fusarium austroafricanum]
MSTPPATETSPKSSKSPVKSTSKSPPELVDTSILSAAHWQQLAEEENPSDANSLSEQSLSTSTDSIASSIFEYRKLHGRTYHREIGNAQYCHHCLTLSLGGKLHLAPIDKDKITFSSKLTVTPRRLTGIWALDFADEHPNVEVIGTDISPIQPSWVSPNLKFEIEDCTQDWTFAPNSADYIHIRWLIGSIPDWYQFFREAYKTCKPGGWVESFEPAGHITSDDNTVKDSSALGQWGKLFVEGGKKIGMSFSIYGEEIQRKAMEAAGFVDIQQYEFKTPIGDWPKDPEMKELGELSRHVFLSDTEGVVLFVANTIGWTEAEIHVYIAHVRKEINSGKYHAYYNQRVVWGRKPAE